MPTKEKLFPYETFSVRLEYKERRDTKICWFQCFDHFQKYMLRYGLNPKDCKIDFAPGTDINIRKISRGQSGKDYKTKKLFSNLETFFDENRSKRTTKTNRKKS